MSCAGLAIRTRCCPWRRRSSCVRRDSPSPPASSQPGSARSSSRRRSCGRRRRSAGASRGLERFAAAGVDHVTVAEVADAAGVSEKTVFNYFHSEEDVFYDEVGERKEALVAAVRDREPGESVLAALRRMDVADCGRMSSPGFAGFARIIEGSPALRAKELEIMADFTRVLGDAIEHELGVDELDAR